MDAFTAWFMVVNVKVTEKTPPFRRKTINYTGTPVKKDLFDRSNKGKKIKNTSTRKKQKQESNFKINSDNNLCLEGTCDHS